MTDTGNSSDTERRKQPRYAAGDLKLSVAYTGIKGMLKFNPMVKCVDFSSAGLQFECKQRFRLGDRLCIDLCIQDECIYELCGAVCHTRKINDTNLYGLRFCFEEKRMQQEDVKRTLLNIESTLRLHVQYPESDEPAEQSSRPQSP